MSLRESVLPEGEIKGEKIDTQNIALDNLKKKFFGNKI